MLGAGDIVVNKNSDIFFFGWHLPRWLKSSDNNGRFDSPPGFLSAQTIASSSHGRTSQSHSSFMNSAIAKRNGNIGLSKACGWEFRSVACVCNAICQLLTCSWIHSHTFPLILQFENWSTAAESIFKSERDCFTKAYFPQEQVQDQGCSS